MVAVRMLSFVRMTADKFLSSDSRDRSRRHDHDTWPDNSEILGPGSTPPLARIDITAPLGAIYRTTVLG
ncbi:MAG: hypothetical protein AB7O80_09385 [Acetobacteraceae bacterium]